MPKLKEDKGKKRSLGKKRKNMENGNQFDDEQVNNYNIKDNSNEEMKKGKLSRNKKIKKDKIVDVEIDEVDKAYSEMEDGRGEWNDSNEAGEKEKRKSRKKKRKVEKKIEKAVIETETEDGSEQRNDDGKMKATQEQTKHSDVQNEADVGTIFSSSKSKKARKMKKKNHVISEDKGRAEEYDVYQISSGDEDSSRGMRKWIMEYRQSRPGIKILQKRIDDFITAYEEQEEQAKKEREARVAEDGWTVVVHHKGRKKTTDSESGTVVGSVSQAAVLDKTPKRKSSEVQLDFYRFQKREAKRNEIMMLQSKFEQDKKRIQKLRAERKFQP